MLINTDVRNVDRLTSVGDRQEYLRSAKREVPKMLPVLLLLLLCWTGRGEARLEKGRPSACSAVEVVGREEWRARPVVRNWTMATPVNHVVVQHTVTYVSRTKASCIRNVQFIQDFHIDERGWWDIAYNFLVCGDGRVYEGRGWDKTGSHSVNFNTNSLGIAFMGNFNKDEPTGPMLEAALNLIDCGVQRGFLTPSREVHGHRDVTCTESPGDKLYAVIRRWRGYKGGRLPAYNCRVLDRPVARQAGRQPRHRRRMRAAAGPTATPPWEGGGRTPERERTTTKCDRGPGAETLILRGKAENKEKLRTRGTLRRSPVV